MSPSAIAVRYVFFAIVAICANLAAQWLVLASLSGAPTASGVVLAIAGGTAVGLMVKYVLDKLYIFGDRRNDLRTQSRTFALYTLTGCLTTAVFWSAEAVGALIDPAGPLMYAAGATGLAIGYVIKYRLDRWFTFAAAP